MGKLAIIILSLILYWSPNVEPDMLKYNIYKSIEDSTAGFEFYGETFHPDTEFVDIATQDGTLYSYYLRAVNDQYYYSVPSDTVSLFYEDIPSYIEPLDEKSNLKVFPNPSSFYFKVNTDLVNYSISMYNILGQKVLESKNLNGLTIIIHNLPSGQYFIKIDNNTYKHLVIDN